MSEEIKDAGKTVPRAMIGAYLMNGSLGIIFLISYMFMITDVEAALNDSSGYAHIWVFSQAVSKGGVVALNTIPIVLIFAGTLTYNLSTSRQTWAFARDHGLPFSMDLNGQQETGDSCELSHRDLFDHYCALAH
jgi:choline transport protein